MAQPIPALKTRQPSGIVPPPLVLIEGEEKSGKSFIAAKLTKSPRVGDCFWLDLNEGAADEYGPIGNYQVIDHNGTWREIYDQVRAVHAHAEKAKAAGEKPVVLVIDSMTAEWDMLKDWISARAEDNKANKKLLAEDPNAEIRIPNNLWNEANAKHRKLMRLLMTFSGIVVVTARGKEVAVVRNGRPVEGEKEWKPETQKAVPYDVTAWINMKRDGATLTGARSLHIGVQPGKDKPLRMPDDWYDAEHGGLDWFIFDAMKFDPEAASNRQITELDTENVDDGEPTVGDLTRMVQSSWDSLEGLSIAEGIGEEYGLLDLEVEGPGGRPSTLRSIIGGRVQELKKIDQGEVHTRAPEPENARTDARTEQSERAQEPQETRAQEQEPERAPEPEDARGREVTVAQAVEKGRAPEQAPAPQQARKENGQERMMRLAREELSYLADVLGAPLRDFVRPALTNPDDLSTLHPHKARALAVESRPRAIAALRDQGRASEAEVYERRGQAFPMLLDFVDAREQAPEPARQG